MEQYRSGHNEADSKSVSLSRPVGSNPTCSAKRKALCLFRAKSFLLGRISTPMLSLHPQPVNKTQNALPEIRRAAHHSRALPSDPPPMYINACPSGTPQRKGKIPERDLAAARYMDISAPSCVNSNRSHISTSSSSKRYLLPSRDSPPLRPAYLSFDVTSSDSIVSQHQLMIAFSGPIKSSQPSPFQHGS